MNLNCQFLRDVRLVFTAAIFVGASACVGAVFGFPSSAIVEAPVDKDRMTMATHPHAVTARREALAEQTFESKLQESHGKAERLHTLGGTQPTVRSALVVYDWDPGVTAGRLEYLYAILLSNVLSHFVDDVQLTALGDYQTGDVEVYGATFYLGAWTNSALPSAFVNDILSTTRTVVWVYGNIDRLARQTGTTTQALFGFSVESLREYNAPASLETRYPGFFDTVFYKGLPFIKYYAFDVDTGSATASPSLAEVELHDEKQAMSHVDIGNLVTGETRPYLVQSGNIWFLADNPFTFNHARDRYLVLSDVLHDILGVQHAVEHRALVRLEDVHVMIRPEAIDRITDFFHQRDIPFSIAAIPRFRDPLASTGRRESMVDLDDWTAFPLIRSLQRARSKGASIVMHGVTHQLGDTANPFDGVSGSDYEFFDVVSNAPPPTDTHDYHLQRLTEGRTILSNADLEPIAFEVPHYLASPSASQAIAQVFGATYQRVTYFTSDNPELECGEGPCDHMAGQFFPFVIPRDHYGQRVIPENIGNLQYNTPFQPKEFLIRNAEYGRTVRDGFASFFFHPFLVEDIEGIDAFADLEAIVDGITELGYRWTDPRSLLEYKEP